MTHFEPFDRFRNPTVGFLGFMMLLGEVVNHFDRRKPIYRWKQKKCLKLREGLSELLYRFMLSLKFTKKLQRMKST